MQAHLVVVSGKASKPNVELRLPTVIGRSREADLTVAHPMISRRHCELFEHNGVLMLRDLESLNGTTMAGRRIRLAPLLPGSEFTVGPLTFRAEYDFHGTIDMVPTTEFADHGVAGTVSVSDSPGEPAGQEMPEFTDMSADLPLAVLPPEAQSPGGMHALAHPQPANSPWQNAPPTGFPAPAAPSGQPAAQPAAQPEPQPKPSAHKQEEEDDGFGDFLAGLE